MQGVVSHLYFHEPVEWLFERAEAELGAGMRGIEGFRGLYVVQQSPEHVILVILADDAAAIDRIATEVGTPWMVTNVVPLLARPPERSVGEVVAAVSV